MCGIFGIKSALPLNDKIILVKKNCKLLDHRGPDFSGIWFDTHLWFYTKCHNRVHNNIPKYSFSPRIDSLSLK